MPPTILPVLWKDSHRRGLRGIVEVPKSDLPQNESKDATIGDLIAVLDRKLRGFSRKVDAVLLYGTRLSSDRQLEAIIPDLAGSSPRLIATLQAPPSDIPDIVVVVEMLTGKTTRAPCMPRDTVANLKLRIQEAEDIPTNVQILAFNNALLEDLGTLESYQIHNRSLIYLALRLDGGFVPPESIAGVPTNSILTLNGPRWCVAYEGLNVEGKCTTRSCAAFGQLIIHPYQFESFNLVLEGGIFCPVCHVRVEPLTCGFYHCAWKFEGVRAHDGLSISSGWKDASGNKYHYLSSGVRCVECLLIVVKARRVSNVAKLVGY